MRAKLFRNGRSQAVRLPASFRFEGTEVDIERDETDGSVRLRPVRSTPLDWLRRRAEVCDNAETPDELAGFFDDLNDQRSPSERPWP
jgi:antitoxin VapB